MSTRRTATRKRTTRRKNLASTKRRYFLPAVIAEARTHCPADTHGDRHAYRRGCRCPDAREDKRLHQNTITRAHAEAPGGSGMNLVDGTGTRRRCQALAAINWPLSEQAKLLGLERTSVAKWLNRPSTLVQSRTVKAMAALYEQLQHTTGPGDARTERWAARQDFRPPRAWRGLDIDNPKTTPWHVGPDVEWVNVERMIDAARGRAVGNLPQLTLDEKAAVAMEIMDRFTLPAAALTRVFCMEPPFAQYLVGKGNHGHGVTTAQLTRDDTAGNFQPRLRARDIPPDYIDHGREAMVA